MQGRSRLTTRRFRPARAAVAAVLAITLAGCWPAPGQGPDRNSYNPFETVITTRTVRTLEPLWTATLESPESSATVGPPVVSNADVHVSDSSSLYTFDAATGALRWRYPDPPVISGAVADPLVDGDRVLFSLGIKVGFGGGWFSDAQWFDARTGGDRGDLPGSRFTSRRGTHLTAFSAYGGPANGIYVAMLQVHDLENPSAGWSAVLQIGNAPGTAPPVTLGARRVYFAGAATASFPWVDAIGVRAFALTPPPAECVPPPDPRLPGLPCPLWATPTAAVPVTSPVLSPDESTLYVGTDDGTLLALDAADGHVLWSAALGATPSADPALAEGRLYVALANGDLVALPADGCGEPTCDVAWRAPVGGAGRQPAVAGGVVFVGTDAGELVALRASGCRAATCRPLWRGEVDGPVTGAPAVSNGRVYVGVSPHQVVAFAPA